ncbi:MAG: SUMF1/EgtB/PvdO family nonheme iron enzyme [Planctomycetota bacterium]
MAEMRRGLVVGEYNLCERTGVAFAEIPSGVFYAGHRAAFQVNTRGFLLGRYPVTNQQWHRFVQSTDYWPEDSDFGRYLLHWGGSRTPPSELLDHPVTWISLRDAMNYAAWAEASVPSEWYWEKAARGLDGRLCPWGDDVTLAPSLCHVRQRQTAEVDRYAHVRTAFGCEQMIGNVGELCLRADDPRGDLSQTPNVDELQDDHVVIRGGCYFRKSHNTMVCSHRRRLGASRRNSWTGLRILRALSPPPP